MNLPRGIQMSPGSPARGEGAASQQAGWVKGVPAAGGEAGPSLGACAQVTHQQDLD